METSEAPQRILQKLETAGLIDVDGEINDTFPREKNSFCRCRNMSPLDVRTSSTFFLPPVQIRGVNLSPLKIRIRNLFQLERNYARKVSTDE